MSRLFKRTFALTFARMPVGVYFADTIANLSATVVTDLRVAFEMEKEHKISELGEVSRPAPNRATIRVWNLSADTRASLEYRPTYVRLEAGYDGTTRRLFEGDLLYCNSVREGVDWITELQVVEGMRAAKEARVNRSYKGGVSARTAVKEIAKAMGLQPPRNDEMTALVTQYVNGLSLYGNAATELTRILAPHGISWSIQDGRLIFLRDSDVRPGQYVEVKQDGGLVGSPSFGTPEKPGRRPVLTATSLLNPGIVPGGRVKVTSLTANGIFRVERVTHSGDSFGDEWFTTFEGKQAITV